MHELVHLALGISTIDAGGKEGVVRSAKNRIEKFCNTVAAEIIVPCDDFVQYVPSNWQSRGIIFLGELATRYKVSRQVIAIRLVECGFADRDWLRKTWKLLKIKSQKKSGGAIPRHEFALSRYGQSFCKTVLSAYTTGEIHGGQLTGLIGLTLKHVPKLLGKLYPTMVHPRKQG